MQKANELNNIRKMKFYSKIESERINVVKKNESALSVIIR